MPAVLCPLSLLFASLCEADCSPLFAMDCRSPSFRSRVLSIQSHVVHGCVGNSAATFPMQIRGVDVDAFNILSFSNHTGYALSKGYRITPEQFQSISEGLRLNKFTMGYNFILSGYVGNAAVMSEISSFVKSVQMEANEVGRPAPVYVCDPVCGDLGKLYVTEECVDVYRNALLPLASIALPNGFEASVLSKIDVDSVEGAIKAADWFHEVPQVSTVVIKSFRDTRLDPDGKFIFMLVSDAIFEQNTEKKVILSRQRQLIKVEYVHGYFTGTGDCFGGLFMAHYARSSFMRQLGEPHASIQDCVAAAASATLGVLKRTQAYRCSITGEAVIKDAERGQSSSDDFDARELLIIHSADVLMKDTITVEVEDIREQF